MKEGKVTRESEYSKRTDMEYVKASREEEYEEKETKKV